MSSSLTLFWFGNQTFSPDIYCRYVHLYVRLHCPIHWCWVRVALSQGVGNNCAFFWCLRHRLRVKLAPWEPSHTAHGCHTCEFALWVQVSVGGEHAQNRIAYGHYYWDSNVSGRSFPFSWVLGHICHFGKNKCFQILPIFTLVCKYSELALFWFKDIFLLETFYCLKVRADIITTLPPG